MNMRYACSGNIRIEPQPGAIGSCQICGNEVKAYCGNINIWHWRHKNLPDCDSFYEPMSEWHKNWQNQFPEDWREVFLERNNEKHFADIFTPQNLVIEFQNSSISSVKIIERELFYKKMIWVVNAVGFKKNLIYNELLDEHIANLNKKYSRTILHKEISNRIDMEIINLKRDINNLKNEQFRNPSTIERKKETLNFYIETLNNLDKYLSNEAFETWQKKGRIFYSYSENLDINEVEIRRQIIEVKQKISSNSELVLQIDIKLQEVDFSVQGEEIKKVLKVQKNVIQENIRVLNNKLHDIHIYVKSIFLEGLPNLIEKEGLEIKKIIEDAPKTKLDIISKNIALDELSKTKEKRISDFLDEKTLEFRKEKKIIKEEYGNIYSYEWKHKRNTWKSASSPIFLDLDDEYLFEIKSTNLLKRISKSQFIKDYSI